MMNLSGLTALANLVNSGGGGGSSAGNGANSGNGAAAAAAAAAAAQNGHGGELYPVPPGLPPGLPPVPPPPGPAPTREEGTTSNIPMLPQSLLVCQSCQKQYTDPCLLACFHTFCARCLRAHITPEKQVVCSICGCANCDRNEKNAMFFCNTCVCWSSQRECDHILNIINKETGLVIGEMSPLSMFYCNTCGQALCGPCREDTHRAKMFSQHDIIHISMKAKQLNQKCPMHAEMLTMFCSTTKAMLCMKCFSEASLETRLHCLDIDLAYDQGKKKFKRALQSIQDIQMSLRDGSTIFQRHSDELKQVINSEREAIHASYNELYDALRRRYEATMREIDSDFKQKNSQLLQQLQSIRVNLPVVQTQLILCSAFATKANKHEFLALSHGLVERLATLAQATFPLNLPDKNDLDSDYSRSFIRALDEVLSEARARIADIAGNNNNNNNNNPSEAGATGTSSSASGQSGVELRGSSSGSLTSQSVQVNPEDFIEAKMDLEKKAAGGNYFNHCNAIIKRNVKVLHDDMDNIRSQLSVLHQDISTQKCLSNTGQVDTLSKDCSAMKQSMDKVCRLLDEQQRILSAIWEDEQERIRQEQALFRKQVADLSSLHNDLKQIICISEHLHSFVTTGAIDRGKAVEKPDSASTPKSHSKYSPHQKQGQKASKQSSSRSGQHSGSSKTLPSKYSARDRTSRDLLDPSDTRGCQRDRDRSGGEAASRRGAGDSSSREWSGGHGDQRYHHTTLPRSSHSSRHSHHHPHHPHHGHSPTYAEQDTSPYHGSQSRAPSSGDVTQQHPAEMLREQLLSSSRLSFSSEDLPVVRDSADQEEDLSQRDQDPSRGIASWGSRIHSDIPSPVGQEKINRFLGLTGNPPESYGHLSSELSKRGGQLTTFSQPHRSPKLVAPTEKSSRRSRLDGPPHAATSSPLSGSKKRHALGVAAATETDDVVKPGRESEKGKKLSTSTSVSGPSEKRSCSTPDAEAEDLQLDLDEESAGSDSIFKESYAHAGPMTSEPRSPTRMDTIRRRHQHKPVPVIEETQPSEKSPLHSRAKSTSSLHRRSSAPEVDIDVGGYLSPAATHFRSLDHLRDTASFTGSFSSENSESVVQRMLLDDLADTGMALPRSPQELQRAYEQLQQRLHLDMAVQQKHQQRHRVERPVEVHQAMVHSSAAAAMAAEGTKTLARRKKPPPPLEPPPLPPVASEPSALAPPELQPPPAFAPLKKADSFEGHEEAVRTLVQAVQETRKKQEHLQSSVSKRSSRGEL